MSGALPGGASAGGALPGSRPKRSAGIGRSSALLASGTIVSRGLGFLRLILLTYVLGGTQGYVADGFNSATYVPNSVYALIAGGLLTAVLVPQIVRAAVHPDGGAAYINKLVTIAVIGLGGITIVLTAASPVLMPIFLAKPQTLRYAIPFAYWSLPQIFFLGLYTVLGEVLNARRSFGPFTWAPVLNNVVSIATLGLFAVAFGTIDPQHPPAFDGAMNVVLAGGSTLGIAAQALILTLAWRRTGLRYRPDFQWRGVNLGATGRAAGWTFGMLVATQVAGVVQAHMASLASGRYPSSATMATAWLIFMLPHSIITVSLVTVFYPRMSKHAADGDMRALREDLGITTRIVVTILVLATAALLVTALPFSAVFTHTTADTPQVAFVLIAFLVGLLPFTFLFIVQRCFYSLGDTRTPFRFTLVQAAIVIVGALLCGLLPQPVITAGIALVVSFATVVQLAIAVVLLRRRTGGLGGAVVRFAFVKAILGAVPAAGVGAVLLALLGGFDGGWAVGNRIDGLLATALVSLVMAAVYLLVLRALRSPELRIATDLVRARIRPAGGVE